MNLPSFNYINSSLSPPLLTRASFTQLFLAPTQRAPLAHYNKYVKRDKVSVWKTRREFSRR